MSFGYDDFDLDDPYSSYDTSDELTSSSCDSPRSSQESIAIPEASFPDPSIAICNSLDQSKALISDRFNISHTSLRNYNIPGIVILPLKDINLIRKDSRHNRFLKHIIVLPFDDNFPIAHNDFAQCINILN